jgi:adenine-specific DNA-methyltransferase
MVIKKKIQHNRKNGIFYTPSNLANYLTRSLVTSSKLSILDPAYGEGSLLLAAERILHKKNKKSHLHLYGCDTKPINGLLKHLPEANLKKVDFFKYPLDNKHNLILTNPPFVRHHLLDSETITKYRKKYPELTFLNNTSDLWAYFIVKSVAHLKIGGSIGAILPWSFLQADYAIPLRKWLYEYFGEIKLLALSEKYFEDAEERIVLIWMKNFGEKCKSIKLGSADSIKSKIQYLPLSYEDWIANKVLYNRTTDVSELLRTYKDYGFVEFNQCADIRIGVVTGADNFFIMNIASAKEWNFNRKNLLPILTGVREFNNYLIHGNRVLKRLIKLTKSDYRKNMKFILAGKKAEYNLRAHSLLRTPWYKVRIGKMPDAFFPYRISKTPFLLPNKNKAQCTNSVHRIYYKQVNNIERKWIEISILSAIGQLSIEAYSKTYGRGVLKIEPSSLKKSLIVKLNDPSINPVYNQVISELKKNNRQKASKIATEFIRQKLKIPKKIIDQTIQALKYFQDLRMD